MHGRTQTGKHFSPPLDFDARQLAGFLDVVPIGVALADIDGTLTYENSVMRDMLRTQPDELLRNAILRSIEDFRGRSVTSFIPGDHRGEPIRYRLRDRTYTIRGCVLDHSAVSHAQRIAVLVQEGGEAPFPANALRRKYFLTERETEVAGLLAVGKTNAEIASGLRISESTARHHTENVMLKMGVTARAKVAGLMAGYAA